jgi:hypothetical protein
MCHVICRSGTPWPYADDKANYDWKFYAEAMRLAADVYTDPMFCKAYTASNGGAKNGFGVPPLAVHGPCP